MPDSDTLDTWLSSVGKESVQAFQDDFSGLTDVSLCLVYLDGTPALVASNRSLLCFHIEDRNRTRCHMQHQQILERMAQRGVAIIDTCYAGLPASPAPSFATKTWWARFSAAWSLATTSKPSARSMRSATT